MTENLKISIQEEDTTLLNSHQNSRLEQEEQIVAKSTVSESSLKTFIAFIERVLQVLSIGKYGSGVYFKRRLYHSSFVSGIFTIIGAIVIIVLASIDINSFLKRETPKYQSYSISLDEFGKNQFYQQSYGNYFIQANQSFIIGGVNKELTQPLDITCADLKTQFIIVNSEVQTEIIDFGEAACIDSKSIVDQAPLSIAILKIENLNGLYERKMYGDSYMGLIVRGKAIDIVVSQQVNSTIFDGQSLKSHTVYMQLTQYLQNQSIVTYVNSFVTQESQNIWTSTTEDEFNQNSKMNFTLNPPTLTSPFSPLLHDNSFYSTFFLAYVMYDTTKPIMVYRITYESITDLIKAIGAYIGFFSILKVLFSFLNYLYFKKQLKQSFKQSHQDIELLQFGHNHQDLVSIERIMASQVKSNRSASPINL